MESTAKPRVRGTTASRLALAGLAAWALACSGPATRPDLLPITIDTLRPDRLACYGGDAENGASLCGLAAQGTRFEWAFSTPPTTPPWVASILTSRYPRDHRVVKDPHGPYEAPDAPPLADAPVAARLPVLTNNSGWKGIPADQVVGDARSAPAYEHGYQEEIRWFDRDLERLLREVDARAPRPAVLLGADHCEAFGEDEFYFALGRSVVLDQIQGPMLSRPSGDAAGGAVVTRSVSNLDLAPPLPPRLAHLGADGRAEPRDAQRALGHLE
jgi:arylsulfatase A-like enzyme